MLSAAASINFLHLDDEVLEGSSLRQHQLVRNVGWDVDNIALLELGFPAILD